MHENSTVAQAERLVQQRRISDAVALLESDWNNADSVMQLAIWHLTGNYIPRDIARGLLYLRRAVELGHVDAALMEIAFTANGTGGDPDWQLALQRLEKASHVDYVAQGQLETLNMLNLDRDGYPLRPADKIQICDEPAIYHFPAFVSESEARHIVDAVYDILEPSYVIDPTTGVHREHPIRTSDGGAIGPARENLVIAAINRRIASASETDLSNAEALTVLRYRPGQQYRLHHDALPTPNDNQRAKTFIIYLNDGYEGGQTEFPSVGLKFSAQAGDALLFDNCRQDASIIEETKHAGLPVVRGNKWIATRWIRQDRYDPWNNS